jgi:hypothetical protein
MEPRLIAAYSLILIVTLLLAGVIAYQVYHSHERTYRRRLRMERRADEAREVPPGP